MASFSSAFSVFVLIIFNLALISASAELVLEEGYTVTTVINGNKIGVNPYSVLPRVGSSDLIVLDSSSSVFYTVSFPLSSDSAINRLAGSKSGYSDGASVSAQFQNPKSFDVDLKGNVYVADKKNHAIRKISKSGVSTIAGGFTQSEGIIGNQDGPAQNATFSSDFEVTFVAEDCSLLVSDHGNLLVRRINLKSEDCATESKSGVGAVSVWNVGIGFLCLLLGLVVGIAIRPYVIRSECLINTWYSMTWKLFYHINQKKRIQTLFSVTRSVVASSGIFMLLKRLFWMSLSLLSLIFRINSMVESPQSQSQSQSQHLYSISLLDSDKSASYDLATPNKYADQLKDLISFAENPELVLNSASKEEGDNGLVESDFLSQCCGRVDNMVEANVMDFIKAAKETRTPLEGSLVGTGGLVKRK